MGEYVSYSGGPGSIAALKPLAALSHAPTISSNDPRGAMAIANEHILGRDIKVKAGRTKGFADPHQPLIKMTHKAMPIRRIGESECAMGGGVESSSIQRLDQQQERVMSEYVMRSDGPGSIGALVPGAALSHPPTIGSNDPRRNINPRSHGAYRIPALGQTPVQQAALFGNAGCGCSSGMGTEGNGGMPSWAAPVGILAVIVGGVWWLKRSKARDEQAEALARYGYGQ
jgi:hypothetical protein